MNETYGIRPHIGWFGQFTTREQPGAYPNNTRVVKTVKARHDMRPVGTQGTVLGSIPVHRVDVGYFVEWDDLPGHAVFEPAEKIRRA